MADKIIGDIIKSGVLGKRDLSDVVNALVDCWTHHSARFLDEFLAHLREGENLSLESEDNSGTSRAPENGGDVPDWADGTLPEFGINCDVSLWSLC